MSKATRFVIEQQDIVITDRAGVATVGSIVEGSALRSRLSDVRLEDRPRPKIGHYDVVSSMIALLTQGDKHFDDVEKRREDLVFQKALGMTTVPSAPTVRQRCEQGAKAFEPIIAEEAVKIIRKFDATITPVETPANGKMIPLDVDLMLQDNSGTKKEGVSRTYKGFDGYGINAAYAGVEGYAVHARLQKGNHHANWNHTAFLRKAIRNAQRTGASYRFLVRMDSGNDADENVQVCREENVSWLIKRNFRRRDQDYWIDKTVQEGRLIEKNALRSVWVYSEWRENEKGEKERFIFRVTHKHARKEKGRIQRFLFPEVSVDSWRTDLDGAEEAIIELYKDHGTSEQFHSEYKTDLDMERLPSQSFDVNRLMLSMSLFAYNALRLIGQASLQLGYQRPSEIRERGVVRRRLRTVIHDFIHVAARLTRRSRQWKLVLSRYAWQSSLWEKVYSWFCARVCAT